MQPASYLSTQGSRDVFVLLWQGVPISEEFGMKGDAWMTMCG